MDLSEKYRAKSTQLVLNIFKKFRINHSDLICYIQIIFTTTIYRCSVLKQLNLPQIHKHPQSTYRVSRYKTIRSNGAQRAIVESDQIFTTSAGRVIANKSCDRSIMIVRSGRTIEWRSNRSIGSSTRPAGKRVHTNRWHGFLYRIIYRIYAVTVHASSCAFPWCNVLCHCLHRVALHQLHRVETPSHQCAKRCTTQIDSRYETASASVFASLQENSSEAFLMLILWAPCLSLYWKKNDIILQSNTVGKKDEYSTAKVYNEITLFSFVVASR